MEGNQAKMRPQRTHVTLKKYGVYIELYTLAITDNGGIRNQVDIQLKSTDPKAYKKDGTLKANFLKKLDKDADFMNTLADWFVEVETQGEFRERLNELTEYVTPKGFKVMEPNATLNYRTLGATMQLWSGFSRVQYIGYSAIKYLEDLGKVPPDYAEVFVQEIGIDDLKDKVTESAVKDGMTLTQHELSQFTGTGNFYRHPLIRSVVYTDGIQHIGANGLGWLVDYIATEIRDKLLKSGEWMASVRVNEETATAVCVIENQDGQEIKSTKQFDFIDLAGLPELEIWITKEAHGFTMLLPSEY